MNQKTVLSTIIVLTFLLAFQTSADHLITAQISLNDLEIGEPSILPGNPFYFFKNFSRTVRSVFAFDPLAKAELRLKFANERIAETQKLIENKESQEIIEKSIENYQRELEKLEKSREKLTDKIAEFEAKKKEKVEKFLLRIADQKTKQLEVLKRVEILVPPQAKDAILKAQENIRKNLERKEEQFCIQLYDPVCGKDGKTYSNECFAGLAGVQIAYKGACLVETPKESPFPSPTPKLSPPPKPSPTPIIKELPKTLTVEVNGRFNPSIITIKRNDTVIWINRGTNPVWPASAVHPTHTLYPGSGIEKCGSLGPLKIFDACNGLAKGQSFSFTFEFSGTWRYHDHLNPGNTGAVEVIE